MSNLRVSSYARNLMLDVLIKQLAGGTLEMYSGNQPAGSDLAISGAVLLAVLHFSSPAALSAKDGRVVITDIGEDPSARASGEASWARLKDASGSAVLDCDIGTKDATIVLNRVDVGEGGAVRLDALTLMLPAN